MQRSALQTPHIPAATLGELLNTSLEGVNHFILSEISKSFPLIHDVSHHLIASGGKRLRPLLTLAAAEISGYTGPRSITIAACVELLHTATLLHDDVVDNSSLRRGLATANSIWDNKSSILVGDFLFSKAFEILTADGDLSILKTLSNATTKMAEGEVMQMTKGHDLSLTYDEYCQIIYGKTACLFEAAMAVGAIIGGASHRRALEDFGRHLGFAFQITDDLLDYSANDAQLGKSVGDDFREGKMTLPFLWAHEMDTDKSFWVRVNNPLSQEPEDFKAAIQKMETLGVFDRVKKEGLRFAEEAIQSLEDLPESPLRKALEETARGSVHRLR